MVSILVQSTGRECLLFFFSGKSATEKVKNKQWWEREFQRCGGLFNFREMLMSYCANDVTVLRLCALKFRQLFIELCGIDPFGSVTIGLSEVFPYLSP